MSAAVFILYPVEEAASGDERKQSISSLKVSSQQDTDIDSASAKDTMDC